VWPSGSLDTRPGGGSHATRLLGCSVSGHDPSMAHARDRVTPDRGFPPQYGLTVFKYQIRLHLRPGSCKTPTDNHTFRELILGEGAPAAPL